jgi:hypothetical protein
VVFVLSRLGQSRGLEDRGVIRSPVSRTPPRATADGFWLDDPNLPAGSTVRYRCRVDGEERTDEATVAPGPQGQFIYTGGMPSDIEILDVIPPGGTPGLGFSGPRRWPSRPSPPSPRPTPPPSTGYPSAY